MAEGDVGRQVLDLPAGLDTAGMRVRLNGWWTRLPSPPAPPPTRRGMPEEARRSIVSGGGSGRL